MIAIVTGASSGIGEEFCRALDSRGLDCIWLVARRSDRLQEVSKGLRTPCRIVTADLSNIEGIRTVTDAIASEIPEIGVLVNCAGFGRFGRTWEITSEDTVSMISVNVTALVEITRACIPFMRSGSEIVEVCSASAYLPLPELNVYSATKAFVRSFCDALREELRGTGIRVLEVSPGWVGTDFIDISVSGRSVPGKVFKHTVTKEEVVARAMSDLAKGKRRSVCGWYNRFQIFACRHMPRLATNVWRGSLR